jgi:predicted permease
MSLFKSIAASDFRASVDMKFLLGCAGLVLVVYSTAWVVVSAFVKDNARRGALIHGAFRSNYIILGMPVVEALFGADQVASAAVVTAVAIPMFNVLAVFTLEYFRGGTPSFKAILKGISRNSLIWGCVLGLAAALLPVEMPTLILSPVKQLAGAATPIALLALGASLKADTFKAGKGMLLAGVALRLVMAPVIGLGLGILLGFRGVQLGVMLALFASPTAVSSYTMAQQMGADADLAGGLVVATSAVSCLTMFLWSFSLMELGLM